MKLVACSPSTARQASNTRSTAASRSAAMRIIYSYSIQALVIFSVAAQLGTVVVLFSTRKRVAAARQAP